MNNWEGKLRALIECPAAGGAGGGGGAGGAGGDPTLGYQTTVPDLFESYDYYDSQSLEDYPAYPDYFNAGDTIILSRRCIDTDFNTPGNAYGCVDRIGDQASWDQRVIGWCQNDKSFKLSWAAKDTVHPEQFLTMLNCPACGCTPGEYDAPSIDSDRSTIGQG